MTTFAQLRKAALALPETTESQRSGAAVFSVSGKAFAYLTGDGIVQLKVHAAQVLADQALSLDGKGVDGKGVRVPLADVNGKALNALVLAAWTCTAPKRLVAQREARQNEHHRKDLPDGLSRPALRALQTAGIDSLELAATWSEADLLELHGLGPQAIRLLREALGRRGLSPR